MKSVLHREPAQPGSPAFGAERCLSRCKPALGTYVRVTVGGDTEAELFAVTQAVFAEIARLERLMSFHDPASELHRLHLDAPKTWVELSPETEAVLTLALDLARRTAGAFDPTVAGRRVQQRLLPDPGFPVDPLATFRDIDLRDGCVRFARPLLLDLGGIAKGYIVDQALAAIPRGLEAVVDAGGDLKMRPWQHRSVGIRIPEATHPVASLEVTMPAAAVATSAAYFSEGVHPVMDPRTGSAVPETGSVSVFAESCALADALTKIVLLEPATSPFWQTLAGVEVLLIRPDGTQLWRQAA